MAAQCGHVDMVGLLLERGAAANLQSKNGLTALHLAAQDDRTAVARLLTRYGAHIDPQTKVLLAALRHYDSFRSKTHEYRS